jgi:predicted O-linked N-acetylglucosamine transferase (SPINDLY family)
VSPNFNRHPICHFLIPLLEAHDKAQVEVHCYSSVRRPDAFTERVRMAADVWCESVGWSDETLAKRIREDRIDILVDLTQHMADNRLLVFARKPAPVQVAWLGYPASTGLPAMDYRFTDAWLEPEDAAWSESVETPIRLPDSWFCFAPIEAPEPTVVPALRTGQITFGSLNNFCKINEGVLRLWASALQAVEGSRLLLSCPAGSTQSRVRDYFAGHGIAADRLELVARTATRTEYLELYQQIDIGLDSFPYHGGTTTCEALWMGVPVVSLAGQTAVSRLGLSVLTNVGLPELVALSEDEYVRIAVKLARDLPRLEDWRAKLRSRMQASPLMDAPRFARNVENAYRAMWRKWCAVR